MELSDIIINKIKQEGPLSFHDYMDMALYYPGLGYYTSPGNKIGSKGDYVTAPYITPVFGAMLGKQLEEMWCIMQQPSVFTIVEYGAGTGLLCTDVLDYAAGNESFYQSIRYYIIEKNPLADSCIIDNSIHMTIVHHANTIEDIGTFTGCILSNELLDNFAIHRIVMDKQMKEVYVDYDNTFIEVTRNASLPLTDYIKELNIHLPEGYKTEINLDVITWLQQVARFLHQGYIITVDYGYKSDDLYNDKRNNGTLMCYHMHQLDDNPYRKPGRQDITSHVNFSALHHWGKKHGLESCGFTTQAAFLLSLGFKSYLHNILSNGKDIVKAALHEALVTRTLLLDMGQKFKVLIQQKGINQAALSGLQLHSEIIR